MKNLLFKIRANIFEIITIINYKIVPKGYVTSIEEICIKYYNKGIEQGSQKNQQVMDNLEIGQAAKEQYELQGYDEDEFFKSGFQHGFETAIQWYKGIQ